MHAHRVSLVLECDLLNPTFDDVNLQVSVWEFSDVDISVSHEYFIDGDLRQ